MNPPTTEPQIGIENRPIDKVVLDAPLSAPLGPSLGPSLGGPLDAPLDGPLAEIPFVTQPAVSTAAVRLPEVRAGKDANQIRSMFGEIASSYDLANTVLSGGIHHLWRRAIVKFSGARSGQRVLDCATGTGDLALEFKRAVGPLGEVVGTDFCAEMLSFAPEKARKAGLDINFAQADVTNLPYTTGVFSISSISFGIRNVADPVKGLSELARVVRPGGVVMILEFGQPSWPIVRAAFDAYSRYVLPKIGGWITGRKTAYEYLQNSSAKFPCGNDFIAVMKSTGRFTICEARPLTFGVAYMYKGIVK